MKTYPARTPITMIHHFDRSKKVAIECSKHPDSKWVSKDPFVSHLFTAPTNSTAFGDPIVECDCGLGNYVTSTEYTA